MVYLQHIIKRNRKLVLGFEHTRTEGLNSEPFKRDLASKQEKKPQNKEASNSETKVYCQRSDFFFFFSFFLTFIFYDNNDNNKSNNNNNDIFYLSQREI